MMIILSFFLFSCCGEKITIIPEIEVPTSVQKGELQVIWQAPLGVTDTNIYLSQGPTIIEDKIAIAGGGGIQFRKKENGELLSFWEDHFGSSFNHSQRPQIFGQNIFVNSQIKTYLIDSNNGETIWKHLIEHGAPYTNITLGKIFHSIRDDSPQKVNFSYLTEIYPNSGERDTILLIPKINNYNPNLEPPAGWITPNNDSLLFFVNRSLNFGGDLDEQLDAYAYNMTADSIEWKLTDFDIEGTSRVGPPLVEDDLVFISGERTLYCLNAVDGTSVWEHRFEDDTGGFSESLFISASIKIGHRLIISPTNSNTYCFDAFTGQILWKETDSASSPQNMVHHNGVIYTVGNGDGKLFAFDLETGEHYWRAFPPNRRSDSRASFSNEIDLDPETGYIYLDDRFFVLCIEPYERK